MLVTDFPQLTLLSHCWRYNSLLEYFFFQRLAQRYTLPTYSALSVYDYIQTMCFTH